MQLIRITTTPLRYELNSVPAHLQISQERPRVQMNKQGGEWDIRQQQVQVQLDTTERRNSIGLKTMSAFMQDAADRGYQAALQATGDYADLGNQLLHIEKGASIPNAMYNRTMQRARTELVLVPISPTDISWIPGRADISYTPVNLNFDWNVGRARMEFVAGSLSMNIMQYPSIQIEYLGGPVYVPPSAAPGFEATA